LRGLITSLAGRRVALRLPLAGMFAIDDECGKSAWEVLRDRGKGQVRVEQVDAVLFNGLLGGGASLVETYTIMEDVRQAEQPLHHYLGIARQALHAALDAPESARRGEADGEPFNRKSVYRSALAMGLRPADVDAMTLHDFLVLVAAFTSNAGGMSEAEKDELWEWIREG